MSFVKKIRMCYQALSTLVLVKLNIENKYCKTYSTQSVTNFNYIRSFEKNSIGTYLL